MSLPLHNDTRTALFHDGRGKAAAVLDGLYAANINPHEWISLKDVRGLIPNATQHQIRYGLADTEIFECQRQHTGKRGQPSYLYRVPDRDELRRRFVPQEKQTHNFADNLPAWSYKKVSEYKRGILDAFMDRRLSMIENKNNTFEGFSCPTAFLADMLDVSPQTIRAYKKTLNITSKAQFNRDRITEKELRKLPTDRHPGREFMEVGTQDELEAGKARRYPLVRDLATLFVRAGLIVWHTTQIASKLNIPPNVARYAGAGRYEYEASVIHANFSYAEAAA
jgi:hypothetical protein